MTASSSGLPTLTPTTLLLSLIKGVIGPAVLYLPSSFSSSGWSFALPMLTVTVSLFLWSTHALLAAWEDEKEKQDRIVRNAMEEAVEEARVDDEKPLLMEDDATLSRERLTSSSPINPLPLPTLQGVELTFPSLVSLTFPGRFFPFLTTLMIWSQQTGLTLTYYIFVSSNLAKVFSIEQEWCIILMLLVQLPLCVVEDIALLSQTNAVANGLILYGVTSVLMYASFFSDEAEEWVPVRGEKWYLFIGTSVLLYEGLITLGEERDRGPTLPRTSPGF